MLSVIYRTGVAIGQKLTLSLLATFTLKVLSFHMNAPFPVLLPFLNALEVMFCECSVLPAILLPSLQLCQNGGIFNWGNREESQGTKSGE
jgi:hypothetical protein